MGATLPGSEQMIMRVIPSSGEEVPVVGLGTWQTFDVDPSKLDRSAEVLRALVKLGGRVIDSSPMYGRSEQVIGELLTKLGLRDSVFLATKVWNPTGNKLGSSRWNARLPVCKRRQSI